MQNLSGVSQLNGNINVVIEDVLQYLVNSVEFHGSHGVLEIFLLIRNALSAHVATAYRSLFLLVCDCFKDPDRLGTLDAEELFARLAVVTNILEIELAVATLLISTVLGGCCLLNELLHLGLCCKIKWGMTTSVFNLDVDSTREEALEHLLGT